MMTAINDMLGQPLGEAIGWALLQFVWQGTLIAVLTAALLAALRRSGPDVRYVISSIALAVMLTVPVVAVVQALGADAAAAEQPAAAPPKATITSRPVAAPGTPAGVLPAEFASRVLPS